MNVIGVESLNLFKRVWSPKEFLATNFMYVVKVLGKFPGLRIFTCLVAKRYRQCYLTLPAGRNFQ